MHQLTEEHTKSMIVNRSQNLQVMRHYKTEIAIQSMIGSPVNPGPLVEQYLSGSKKNCR